MVSHSFFMSYPEDFYIFYKEHLVFENALPNQGHYYIASLQDNKHVTCITQNIDGLHQKAGSKIVYELHGSIHRNYCMKCHKFYDLNSI